MDAEDILFEEIDDLDSRWRRDVKQRKVQKALTFISQHIRVLSPMRRLPSELLREIFVWLSPCLQIYPDSAQNWPSSKDLPWAVSQVCRSWRAIALSLPSLWNHLPLVRKTPDNQFQLDVLKELLRRTGEAPLDIYFYFSHQFEHSTHPIINLLLRHCERWQYVTVYASFATLAAFEPIKRRLPTLRALTVTTYAGRASTTFSPLQFDAFEVAPKLREVELDLNLADNHTIKLPFSQLVYYKDHSSSRLAIHELQQVLASPFLETLILCADMLGVSFSFPPIILPRLRKLRLSDCFHYSYIGFLDRITVPAIEVLEIDGNMPLATLISMISRSDTPCRLKALVVRMATTHSSGDLRALLELTPALEILDISLVSANVLYALH
ncbi:hypothetical protein BDZ97DRAFT_1788618 [Flammula alnicola]|nr:hypothetical protein BDZ97DRAFT_1788618 [Flammula alnicola]